jgi:hypothetical protein
MTDGFLGLEINIADAIAAIKSLAQDKVPAFILALRNELALESKKVMTEKAPIDKGRLRSSIAITETGSGVEIGPHTNYAWWVATGTDPHIIFPSKKKALFWKGAKHPVAYVEHPGTKAQPFHEWTYAEIKDRAPVMVKALAKKYLTIGGGGSGG